LKKCVARNFHIESDNSAGAIWHFLKILDLFVLHSSRIRFYAGN